MMQGRAWILLSVLPTGCLIREDDLDRWAKEGASASSNHSTPPGDGAEDETAADGGSSGEDAGGGTADAHGGVAENRAPSMPEIALVSRLPLTTDDLVVQILAEAVDPDGDGVSYQYRWLQNGALRVDLTDPTVPALETSRGDVWEVEVIATDGVANAPGARSSATVQNSPPSLDPVTLNPDPLFTDDVLRASTSGSDADGDPLTYTYAWTVNRLAVESDGSTLSGVDSFSKGDVVQVIVTASDGLASSSVASPSVAVQNSPPSLAWVGLSASTVYTNDNLTASASADDADGDPVTYSYAWTVNGVARGGNTATFSGASYFAKGDVVQVTVTPSDGTASGTAASSAAVTIQNSAPTVSSVSLSPSTVRTNDTISASVTGTDADGDAVSYSYAWTVNGVARGSSSPTLSGTTYFSKGDVVRLAVTPTDATESGTSYYGGSVTVQNSAPTVSMVTLSPSTVRTNDTILASVSASDSDGDALTYTYAWTVNGTARGGSTSTLSGASYFSKGDVVRVTVTPNDGTVSGTGGLSSTVTVQNSAPTVSSVTLSPATVRTNDTITATVGANDVDGDGVSFTYAWTVNGVARGTSSATLSGASYFAKGDVVGVRVTPNDGTASGTGVLSTAGTVQNTTPSTPTVTVSPSSPRAGRALVCSASSTDADGDTLTYSYSWTVDGVTHPGSSATVALGETLPGEVWRCLATASDGTSTSSAGSRTVTVGATGCNDGAVSLTASGIQFVTVCGGTFDMGCTPGQSSCSSDESPVRATTLTRDYYVSRTEVTQGQFSAVMGYNPSSFTACGSACPVEEVTWHESAAFANAVSTASGLPNCYACTGSGTSVSCTAPADPYACAGYRLPTEAEWEGAARCGEDLLYAGSVVIDEVARYDSSPGSTTFGVAGLSPNACGLYDMSGNVFEWVNDSYLYGPYSDASATDPIGIASGSSRGLRGGSWSTDPSYLRVANRGSYPAVGLADTLGLRLVRTAP